MTGLGILAALLGFVVVALGGRLIAMKLRRDGHGETLDVLHDKAVGLQLRVLKGKAFLLRAGRPPTHSNRPGAGPPQPPENH